MSAKPWFKFQVADFRVEMIKLTPAQRGGYVCLIMYYWEHEGLPEDDQQLARIAGMTPREWTRNREAVVSLFGPSMTHSRMSSMLCEWLEKSNKRKEAAMQMHNK